MSGTIQLHVTSNGNALRGDGPDGAIECLGFDSGVTTARESRQGLVTGRRTYATIIARKRVDRASPLLLRALTENQAIEARFDFLRPEAPAVSSAVFYTVRIVEARLVSVRQYLAEPAPGARTVVSTPMEEVGFEFRRITWTHVESGLEHQDSVSS